jgi:hypothetical protein
MTVHLRIKRGSHNAGIKGPHKHKRKNPTSTIANCVVCRGAFEPHEHLGLLLRLKMHYISRQNDPFHLAKLDLRTQRALRNEPGI